MCRAGVLFLCYGILMRGAITSSTVNGKLHSTLALKEHWFMKMHVCRRVCFLACRTLFGKTAAWDTAIRWGVCCTSAVGSSVVPVYTNAALILAIHSQSAIQSQCIFLFSCEQQFGSQMLLARQWCDYEAIQSARPATPSVTSAAPKGR
jgi:hypothetical protein